MTNPMFVRLSRIVFVAWMFGVVAMAQSDPTKTVTGDFNGDGKTDVASWNESTKLWDMYLSCGSGLATPVAWDGMWGSDGPVFAADLNGDGKTDIFMWRAANNTWSVNLSNGYRFDGQTWKGAWGSDGPIFTGDLNGDGKTDVFMWRASDKVWTVNLSTGTGFTQQIWTGAWGSDGPIFTGDLNGDGKTDVFMWRASDKVWTVNLSTGTGFTQQIWKGAWGSDGPINVADLNGDGKADVFMWRAADRVWTVNLSTGTGFNSFMWQGTWGSDGPIHIVDLNGDKKQDVLMWRASDNTWSVNLSTGQGWNADSWSSAATPVPVINSFKADQTMLAHADDQIILRFDITAPQACNLKRSIAAYTMDGKFISPAFGVASNSPSSSVSVGGYGLPVQFQLTASCGASSGCGTAKSVTSAFVAVSGPPVLKIKQFEATGNGTTAIAPNPLYVPVGTSPKLSWTIENCNAGCAISLQAKGGTNGPTLFTKTNLSPNGSTTVAPNQTFTTYILSASAASSSDTKSMVVQLAPLAPQQCSSCSWYYFQLNSPPDAATPECFTFAAWAANDAAAKASAQAQATNYTVTEITQDQYNAGCN
jgi:hypothetical protein